MASTIGLALSLGTAHLAILQFRHIIRNTTPFEVIVMSGNNRQCANPFNLGMLRNVKLVLTSQTDGYDWPTFHGANPYAINIEKAAQKRNRLGKFVAVEQCQGQWLPDIRLILSLPLSLKRISFKKGDIITVTENRRIWMLGSVDGGPVGYFPARLVTKQSDDR